MLMVNIIMVIQFLLNVDINEVKQHGNYQIETQHYYGCKVIKIHG